MTRHGRYTILRKIADGGTADIFLAQLEGARGFRKPVVLKRIRSALSDSAHFRNMLVDEAHIAMELNHSNIVQVLDLGEAAGSQFLALELVDGWSWQQVLRRARAANAEIPTSLSLYVVAETCRALAYAHSMSRHGEPLGIVHRDISPQNVLVSEQGEVKLTDFGIAKALVKSEHTMHGVVKGKVAFMSPEQTEAGPLDSRSDLFSLGTVLYVSVTGQLPFTGANDLETMLRVRSGEYAPAHRVNPKVLPEVSRIIDRAMRKNPKERYATAEEMLLDVERVMRSLQPPAGQTELKRWLAALHERDGALPVGREPPTEDSLKNLPAGGTVELVSDASILPPTLPRQRAQRPGAPPKEAAPRRLGLTLSLVAMAVAALGVVGWVVRPSWPAPAALEGVVSRALHPEPVAEPPPAPVAELPPAPVLTEMTAVLPAVDAGGPVDVDAGALASADAGDGVTDAGVLAAAAASDGGRAGSLVSAPDAGAALAARAVPDAGVPLKPAPVPPVRPAAQASSTSSPDPDEDDGQRVTVDVVSNPAGATVRIGRRAFGETPLKLRLRPGIIFELEFVKEGFEPVQRRFLVSAREGQRVYAGLRRVGRTSPRQR